LGLVRAFVNTRLSGVMGLSNVDVVLEVWKDVVIRPAHDGTLGD
jgi:hypothetical protein